MYKVRIKKIEIFGYHGVYDEEKKSGQMFYIDVEYHKKMKNKVSKDSLSEVIDYTDIINCVNEVFNKKRYNLLESLAQDIIGELVAIFHFEYVKVSIQKQCTGISIPVNNITVMVDNRNE